MNHHPTITTKQINKEDDIQNRGSLKKAETSAACMEKEVASLNGTQNRKAAGKLKLTNVKKQGG